MRPGRGARAAAVFVAALLAPAGQAIARQEAIAKRAETCLACHGKGGESVTALTPSLGGQPSFFVSAQLFLFREGRRGDVPMSAFARGLSDADLSGFAELIAKLPPPRPPGAAPDAARFARGKALAAEHHCGSCHNADFSGGEQVPRIANQREDFLLKALRDYRSGARIGYGNAAMGETVAGMGEADLAALAHFLAYLPAAPR